MYEGWHRCFIGGIDITQWHASAIRRTLPLLHVHPVSALRTVRTYYDQEYPNVG